MTKLTRRSLVALLGLAPATQSGLMAARSSNETRTPEPVVLLRTQVNGEDYYDAKESVKTLAVGAPLSLRREPTNAYDRRAIELFDADGRKLGYVPRVDNPAVARMMDAGEAMRARVTSLDARWLDIKIVVEWLRA